ncbi:UDP-glycosyltransferase UGT5-like [Homalodisca vitripennis]|uniref:UDP-glycosyltransferase UGT5-like n=1 Tax=Homalodisca vitripennis TaxID=197043 RepID=UPI001EEAB6DF|nr:UDP-glycosyltransferase UGT5-like [Homalodisca vitripennis]
MKILLVLMSLCELACCARILAMLPFPSKSHSILHNAIFRLLAERGHQVTVYSAYTPPASVANITHVDLPTSLKELTSTWTFEQFKEIVDENHFYGFSVKGYFELSTLACEDVFKNRNIKELLESDESYDLIFLELGLGQESFSVFSHKFKAPIINFHGFTSWSLIDWVPGNALSIAHIPEVASFPFGNKMSLKERLQNFLSTCLSLLYLHLVHLPKQQKLAEQYYKGASYMPHVSEMLKEIAITFINSQKNLEYPRPYTPNMIPIAGAHLATHMTPLPPDIKTFIEKAQEGAIFFSLGTYAPAHLLPSKYIQAFVNAFKKMPQVVIWQIELENIPELPKNVMLTKWAPQPTILSNQHETFHAGKPVVGIPFFREQRYNMKFYEKLGVGITLELNDITEETVYMAITKVLNDSSFRENAKRVSRIVRDQPMSPADTAVYWVEYVLRHGGAPQLKPFSLSLKWYQLFLLDVALYLIVLLALFIVFVYYIMKRMLRFLMETKDIFRFLDNEMRYIFDISQAISAKMSVDMLRHVARRTSSIQMYTKTHKKIQPKQIQFKTCLKRLLVSKAFYSVDESLGYVVIEKVGFEIHHRPRLSGFPSTPYWGKYRCGQHPRMDTVQLPKGPALAVNPTDEDDGYREIVRFY